MLEDREAASRLRLEIYGWKRVMKIQSFFTSLPIIGKMSTLSRRLRGVMVRLLLALKILQKLGWITLMRFIRKIVG
jgi:hypothetical protein